MLKITKTEFLGRWEGIEILNTDCHFGLLLNLYLT